MAGAVCMEEMMGMDSSVERPVFHKLVIMVCDLYKLRGMALAVREFDWFLLGGVVYCWGGVGRSRVISGKSVKI